MCLNLCGKLPLKSFTPDNCDDSHGISVQDLSLFFLNRLTFNIHLNHSTFPHHQVPALPCHPQEALSDFIQVFESATVGVCCLTSAAFKSPGAI